jgi:hypothetical protein
VRLTYPHQAPDPPEILGDSHMDAVPEPATRNFGIGRAKRHRCRWRAGSTAVPRTDYAALVGGSPEAGPGGDVGPAPHRPVAASARGARTRARQAKIDPPRGVAQSGSAFGWGPKGRWFKSSRPDLTKPPHSRRFRASRHRAFPLVRGPFGVQFPKPLCLVRTPRGARRSGLRPRAPGCGPGGRGFESGRSPSSAIPLGTRDSEVMGVARSTSVAGRLRRPIPKASPKPAVDTPRSGRGNRSTRRTRAGSSSTRHS